MRADDRRRERTVAALGRGYAQGALGTDTLSLRVESAFRARTVAELRALTADLRRRWLHGLRPTVPTVRIAPPPEGPGPWTLGRSDRCRLVIRHGTVSRRHAELRRTDEGRLEVCDLGSLNGTWVNGWRVERAAVRPGDTLQLGDVRVVVDR